MEEKNKIELIEKYLTDSLSAEEKALFDSLLKSDSSFRKEFEFQKDLHEDLAGDSFHSFREVLKSAGSNVITEKPEARVKKLNTKFFRNIIGIAASIALILFIYKSFDPSIVETSSQIYANQIDSYPMLLSQRTIDTTDISKSLQKAIESYQREDYTSAANNFKELSQLEPNNPSYQYYTGVSNLLAGKLKLAEPYLKSLEQTSNHLFIEQSRWYLALLKIKNDKKDEAIIFLEKIKPGEYKYDEANLILKNYQ